MKTTCPVCCAEMLATAECLMQPATKSCTNPACGLYDIPLTEKQLVCIEDDISEQCKQSYNEGFEDGVV